MRDAPILFPCFSEKVPLFRAPRSLKTKKIPLNKLKINSLKSKKKSKQGKEQQGTKSSGGALIQFFVCPARIMTFRLRRHRTSGAIQLKSGQKHVSIKKYAEN